MTDHIPLRDYLDQRFSDHRIHVDQQFEDLKTEVRASRSHRHGSYVTWAALVPLLAGLVWGISALLG